MRRRLKIWLQGMTVVAMLEWVGALFGIMGALLLAANSSYSGWGFASFLASNILWMGYGVLKRAHGMITMQIAFMITSFLGLLNWIVL